MKSLALLVLLTVSGTAPDRDNFGTCVNPSLLPMGSNPFLMIHLRWWRAGGDSSSTAADSLRVAPGGAFTFTEATGAGLWRVRGWAADLGGAGCDTTISVDVGKPPPGKPSFRSP